MLFHASQTADKPGGYEEALITDLALEALVKERLMYWEQLRHNQLSPTQLTELGAQLVRLLSWPDIAAKIKQGHIGIEVIVCGNPHLLQELGQRHPEAAQLLNRAIAAREAQVHIRPLQPPCHIGIIGPQR